jgi:hypothetical protein
VLVLDEGNSARQVVDREPDGAIRAVIVGIVDEVEVEGLAFDVEGLRFLPRRRTASSLG